MGEGGGNNFYGEEMRQKLMTEKGVKGALDNMFLMQMIHTPQVHAHMLRNGEVTRVATVSEYSRFGIFLSNRDEVFSNLDAGHLLRTKAANVGEGGVASGYAVINIPYVCPQQIVDGRLVLPEI